MPDITIEGPAGDLEASCSEAGDGVGGAVICHPHPLYGGGMDDAVVAALERGFMERGVSTLRFNFRGVGKSKGTFDNGEGEVEDCKAAFKYLADKGCSEFYLGGYSFGAGVAARCAGDVSLEHLFLVAPPLQYDSFPDFPCRVSVMLGRHDSIVEADAATAWISKLGSEADMLLLEQADHFFHGCLDQITNYVATRL